MSTVLMTGYVSTAYYERIKYKPDLNVLLWQWFGFLGILWNVMEVEN